MKLVELIQSWLAARAARSRALVARSSRQGWGRDGTFPDVGDNVELVQSGGCMGHIHTRRRGKVVKLDAWTPYGAGRAHAFALVDLPNGKNWFPLDNFFREGNVHVCYE